MSDDGQAELDPVVDFIAGTIAGMTSLVVGYPFDTVKVRLQNPDTAKKYRSTSHAVGKIIREERFLGLFKGIQSPLATVALMNGLVFSSYGVFMKLQLGHSEAVPTLTQITLAGAGSGIVSSIITTPIELIKIRQQSCLQPTSAHRVALQIYKESGIPGLYRGITATALRDTGYGAYFLAYEATCRFLASGSLVGGAPPDSRHSAAENLSWPSLLFAGGMAGIFGWLATFPFDVVKTRMQGTERPLPRAPPPNTPLLSSSPAVAAADADPYRTTLSTIVNSYRAEGLSVFFRGLSPTLIRAIPVNMVTFWTYETAVHAMGGRR
ncbi:putative mitochondrial carrier (TC 2.A.29) family protein [Lyophyllum shimeji]|uniref:Mitochondrial carrier (TC 2.A.29) family protein n=1 Tax=Lyophyllum shimeji TaxID=47721 RepID=A0A9P3UST9_LYOSH|nr:putative mitochondrial carrier (TC 2.A.29) family protein [Lyophyllum shimeji]